MSTAGKQNDVGVTEKGGGIHQMPTKVINELHENPMEIDAIES